MNGVKKLTAKKVTIINQTLDDYVKGYKLAHNKDEQRAVDYYCNQFLDVAVKDVTQRGVFMDYYDRHKRSI